MKTAPLLALALAALATPAAADDYATTPSICSHGQLNTDDERGLRIGRQSVLYQNMNCDFARPRKKLAGGWFTSNWKCSMEGEPIDGRVAFDIRVGKGYAEVREDGTVTRYDRCR